MKMKFCCNIARCHANEFRRLNQNVTTRLINGKNKLAIILPTFQISFFSIPLTFCGLISAKAVDGKIGLKTTTQKFSL